MNTPIIGMVAPQVTVKITNNGGHPPEFWAQRAREHIVAVADSAHPALREQAIAFQNRIEAVILHFMREAIKSDRGTLAHQLTNDGDAAVEVRQVLRNL